MNKGDFIKKFAKKSGMTLGDAKNACDAFFNTVMDVLKKDDCIKLVGFGTFKKTLINIKEARNPKTGELVSAKPYNRVIFSASKVFKDAITVMKAAKKEEKKETKKEVSKKKK